MRTSLPTAASTTTPSTLQTFSNSEFGDIRCITKDGEPWFVAADVCKILEHSNPTVAMNSLESFEKAKLNLGLQGGDTNIISESGFYTLVLRSRKRIAQPFRIWVTSEVLPTIRKTGGYVDEKPQYFLVDTITEENKDGLHLIHFPHIKIDFDTLFLGIE